MEGHLTTLHAVPDWSLPREDETLWQQCSVLIQKDSTNMVAERADKTTSL